MDVKVEEEDQPILLLSSLPKLFEYLVTIILDGNDTLKMEEVMTTLLSNKTRSKQGSSIGEDLLIKINDSFRGRSKDKTKRITD